jgi:hypothetical protein
MFNWLITPPSHQFLLLQDSFFCNLIFPFLIFFEMWLGTIEIRQNDRRDKGRVIEYVSPVV